MNVQFTAHNIRLDDGTYTNPDIGFGMEDHPYVLSAKRLLGTLFPSDRGAVRVVDLGCLEGGFSVEFARMGFQVLGLDVRQSNIETCEYVKSRTRLPNLEFARDDAWNVASRGVFDVVFCCGLLYHVDRPREFLRLLSSVATSVLILQTHFAPSADGAATEKYRLTPLTTNESLRGRWFTEYDNEVEFEHRDDARWAAWDNTRSFWLQREDLLQSITETGFDLVLEQFDWCWPDIVQCMTDGYYRTDSRGTFVGIKSVAFAQSANDTTVGAQPLRTRITALERSHRDLSAAYGELETKYRDLEDECSRLRRAARPMLLMRRAARLLRRSGDRWSRPDA